MSTPTASGFDLSAVEQCDAAGQFALYAPEAGVTLFDRFSTPGNPRVLRGREEIAAWLEDVCAREMTHRVEDPVRDGDRAAFVEACLYPDGTNVLCIAMLEVRDGRIVRQVAVQAWDE